MYNHQERTPINNRLLATLSESEYQRIAPNLKLISFFSGEAIYEAQEPIQFVYFPLSAMVSQVYILENGSTIEISLTGNEGMVGLPVFWGGDFINARTVVQVPGKMLKLEADILKSETNRCGELTKLLLLYTQALFTQISLNVACNSQHTIDRRLARWLLSVQDGVQQDNLPLTQEFISDMLGVRRSGVSQAASILQKRGLIRYVRGQIRICDRSALEATACECYEVIKRDYQRLLGDFHG